MRLKFLIALMPLLLTSCSTVFIYSPKIVNFEGDDNTVEIKGSELKEVDLDQESKPKVKVPVI